jgi:2,3-dihydro-2,3-dihydroxybenzoate dehydrogenase
MNNVAFSGRRAWVTGAAQGIGLAVAEALHAAGAEVIGLDRQFAAREYPFRIQTLDVSDAAQVATLCSVLLDEGGVDILVQAAGVLRIGAMDELSVEDWHACMDVNASGAFYVLRALVPVFKRQRRGAIVTVASNAAHVPRMQMAAYCASKAALASLSHCVALELAPYGIRCNVVSPGSTDTPMLRGMLGAGTDNEAAYREGYARTVAGLPDQFKLGIPLAKIATPVEIANTVLFLASDLASHITMQDVVVDGGATLAA